MDAFRRLRFRRRAKANDSASIADDSQTIRSLANPSRTTSPRPSTRNTRSGTAIGFHKREYSRPSVEINNHQRIPSAHRIQPMLVGISRPSTTQSRPRSSGSLQHAVEQAANSAVVNSPGQGPMSPSQPAHTRTKSPRYIDIFAISSRGGMTSPTYNEDIAERNIDTIKLALESSPNSYIATSKYQEEVANRNAYSPEQSTHTRNYERVRGLSGSQIPKPNVPPSIKSNILQLSHDIPLILARPIEDSIPYHSRQLSMREQDRVKHLSVIPQESASDDGSIYDEERSAKKQEKESEKVKAPWSEEIYQREDDSLPTQSTTTTPFASVPANSDMIPSHHIRATVGLPGYETRQAASIPRHSASPSQMFREPSPVADQPAEEWAHGRDPRTIPSEYQTSNGAVSKRQAFNSKRTVLDLTGDDSELFSVYSNEYQETPLLEHATPNTFQRSHASVIHVPGGHVNNEPAFFRAPDTNAGNGVSKFHHAAMQLTGDLDSATHVRQPTPIATPSEHPISSFTFSPINTVASMSPRASRVEISTAESFLIIPHIKISTDVMVESDPTRQYVDTLIKSNAIKKTGVIGEVLENSVITPSASSPRQALVKVEPELPSKPATNKNKVQFAAVPSVEIHDMSDIPVWQTVQASQTSDSMAPTDSDQATEVRTRDFALSPNRSTSIEQNPKPQMVKLLREKDPKKPSMPKSALKPTKDAKQNISVIRKSRPVSSFDEEAFARKQAEANAALVRLQKSLEEDFSVLPLPGKTKVFTAKDYENPTGTDPLSPSKTITHADEGSQAMSPTVAPKNAEHIGQTPALPQETLSRHTSGSQPRLRTADNKSTHINQKVHPTLKLPAYEKGYQRGRSNNGDNRIASPHRSRPMETMNLPPRSPGEVSLSSFPIPLSTTRSPDRSRHSNSTTGSSQRTVQAGGSGNHGMTRRGSNRSEMSGASSFSIPFSMVPGRNSSLRNGPEIAEDDWFND